MSIAAAPPTYAHKQSPSQRVGQWLSMHLIEPYLAFDDPTMRWRRCSRDSRGRSAPASTGLPRCASSPIHEADRNTHLWSKVANDPQYRELARSIWREGFAPSEDPPPES